MAHIYRSTVIWKLQMRELILFGLGGIGNKIDSMSDLMLDIRRALSTIDEEERIWILREMERSCSGILMAIGVNPDSCASWHRVVDVLDMRYMLSSNVLHLPSSYISLMSSFYAAHHYLLIHQWQDFLLPTCFR
uniref:Uncharacterized protein LOC114913994 isoform X1 n=1 Tax=Elaeis guineensis var. tenera TaxID=51953 RepID=A0A8N4F3B1_ELAGV|nr:uncharacterized protein LOC114913994 isoform X1 [Elaeis guineensis]